MAHEHHIVMLGASGAIGSEVVKTLVTQPLLGQLTLLGRRASLHTNEKIESHVVDVLTPISYGHLLAGHDVAICTMGVGQPSKVSQEEFLKVDKIAVLNFATACKAAGVRHFELLSSVSTDATSKSFYLRTKGELEAGLQALNFEHLSIFKPSMIITPNNRYGLVQAITLFAWPLLSPLFGGAARKFRGIKVDALGKAIALNVFKENQGLEELHWNEFQALVE
ncbi:MAG: NAD(P)H-binding protein [Ghiorsea sp.]